MAYTITDTDLGTGERRTYQQTCVVHTSKIEWKRGRRMIVYQVNGRHGPWFTARQLVAVPLGGCEEPMSFAYGNGNGNWSVRSPMHTRTR